MDIKEYECSIYKKVCRDRYLFLYVFPAEFEFRYPSHYATGIQRQVKCIHLITSSLNETRLKGTRNTLFYSLVLHSVLDLNNKLTQMFIS